MNDPIVLEAISRGNPVVFSGARARALRHRPGKKTRRSSSTLPSAACRAAA